jgi:hypothetical protein
MAYTPDEDEEETLDDRDLPDELDMDESDEPELIQCPECRKYIVEDAERCHHCGKYISVESAPRRVPLWMVVGVILMLMAVMVWIFAFRTQ